MEAVIQEAKFQKKIIECNPVAKACIANKHEQNCRSQFTFSTMWERKTKFNIFNLILVVSAQFLPIYATVYPCPDPCICLSDTKVLCSGAGLHQIPAQLSPSVEELNFSRNFLANLSTDMFQHWQRLQSLNLDSNQIDIIQPFAFRGLPNLKMISLQYNKLTALTELSLAGISNLTQLNLGNNRIKIIHSNVFSGSRNIGMLMLQNNPTIRVRSRAFAGLNTVQFLHLPSWIKILEEDAFFGMSGIGLLRLLMIDLHSLREHTFRGLSNVTQISIQDSSLGVLHRNAFAGLRNVGEIRIVNNKVDSLDGLWIGEDLNVDGVLVQGNHFLQVEGTQPIKLEANERNVINGNYFPCNCQLLNLLNSPVAREDRLFLAHNFCISPFSLHGSNISSIDLNSLYHCETPSQPPVRYRTTTEKMNLYHFGSTALHEELASKATSVSRNKSRMDIIFLNGRSGSMTIQGDPWSMRFTVLGLYVFCRL